MQFSAVVAVLFATSALGAPTPPTGRPAVFTATSYNNISISGGVAGQAQAEAQARLAAVNITDAASVNPADLDFLTSVNDICNQAELGAFNPAIMAAAPNSPQQAALQAGKTKNKVLKLTATIMTLNIQAAQGQNVTQRLADETAKLNLNVAADKAVAGSDSMAVQFEALASADSGRAKGLRAAQLSAAACGPTASED
ncbi:hypothetical protein MBM_07622 [Drepanopeziza brunnea f. sp. 'multigermtubi' MB_m1]|uniref:Small secreted protein n=1 Tax=Marssonina brunnea f. sp. multigermtubi (strain MB_m1) TaxID=1072389 RepID=K1WPT5_MARBU|nr:uncharacterized protein MBM_07622 [Drepanopeziza brunnea f. sp. 'multigermtubi' MB_m1]EKD14392.1 hypothetical protein MBM_07622 [Drepanopeziza brunnea f. sp. 'multigermtubi' MB_m1]